MNDENYWNLMSRYLADDLSLEETEVLLQWLNEDSSRAEVLKELQETWDMSKIYPEKFYVDSDAALLKVRRTILSTKSTTGKVHRFAFLKWLCFLGSALLVFGAIFFTLKYFSTTEIIEIETPAAQRKEVILPDGSKVWLNELSSLNYSSNLNDQTARLVKLKGEAYFEIKSDTEKQFLIEAGKTRIQATESSVNVFQDRKGDVKVSVLTGNVFLIAKDKLEQKMMLFQGEEGVNYKEGYMDKSAYRDLNFLSWKTRQLNFNNNSFSAVVLAIEKAYGVKFYVKDQEVLSQKVTASFNKLPIERVVNELEILLHLSIQKAGPVYVVGKGT